MPSADIDAALEILAEEVDEPSQEQAQSTLDAAIESDQFQSVSEAEMEYALSIAAVDTDMSDEQDRLRRVVIDALIDPNTGFPTLLLEQIFVLLNVEGDIGEDEIADAAAFYSEWVTTMITPQVLDQEQFFEAGQVVQSTSEDF